MNYTQLLCYRISNEPYIWRTEQEIDEAERQLSLLRKTDRSLAKGEASQDFPFEWFKTWNEEVLAVWRLMKLIGEVEAVRFGGPNQAFWDVELRFKSGVRELLDITVASRDRSGGERPSLASQQDALKWKYFAKNGHAADNAYYKQTRRNGIEMSPLNARNTGDALDDYASGISFAITNKVKRREGKELQQDVSLAVFCRDMSGHPGFGEDVRVFDFAISKLHGIGISPFKACYILSWHDGWIAKIDGDGRAMRLSEPSAAPS